MQLVWSNDEFKPCSVPVSGFPIHVHRDGTINPAVHSFLVNQLLQQGTAPSKKTWEFYGYSFQGYLKFLESHNRAWDEVPPVGKVSVLAAYRIWMQKHAKGRGTINGRLDVLTRFYQFAQKHGYVKALPFNLVERVAPQAFQSGTHSRKARTATRNVADVKMKSKRTVVKILSAAEAKGFLDALKNRTHNLMARLQLATGIRVEELVTYPAKYVVDPRVHPHVKAFFNVKLDPKDMCTKGMVERTIHVPRALMAMLWAYKSLERVSRYRNSGNPQSALFLTEDGEEYATRSVWSIYRATDAAIGIRINPHLLRHTYATHTLKSLTKVMNRGNALFYVRNRLGHASIATTEKYLHYIDDAVVSIMDEYQSELTKIAMAEAA